MPYSDLKNIFNTFARGDFIMVYDEHREVEGDFFILAEHISAEKINFLFEKAKGMICTACDPNVLKKYNIPLLTNKNENPHGTNFCMPVDAAQNITTGVSAHDRATTIGLFTQKDTRPTDFVRPGHTFTLMAQDPSKRFGHTEAGVEMAKKLKKKPIVVICEILNSKGEKANLEELKTLSDKFNIPMTSLENLKKTLV